MKKIVAVSLAVALALAVAWPTLNTPAYAQEATVEDPHTELTGTLETTTEVIDETVYVTYVLTSDDIKKATGYSTMWRQEEFPRDQFEGQVGTLSEGQIDKKVEKNAKIKVNFEKDKDKLDKYQKEKNNGIPMNAYLKWSVGEPVAQDSPAVDSSANLLAGLLRSLGIVQYAEATHVEKWAHKTNAFSPYDPINVIWTDPVGTGSSVVATDVHNRFIGKSWGTISACIVVSTLYVNVNGVYKGQDQHKFKNIAGCDQYHVRIWSISGTVAIGAAHQEIAYGSFTDVRHISSSGPNYWEEDYPPGHIVTSWENGESQVRSAFTGSSSERFPTCWTPTANAHSMSNSYTREHWNDERTTQLYTATSSSTASTIDQKKC